MTSGEIEVDESYSGGGRKGERGRGAAGEVSVSGLLKSNAHAHAHAMIIPHARSETLFPIIREKVRPHSIVYADTFRAYDVLDVSEFHHLRINHSELFVADANHINGVENFWNQAKRRLRRCNGVPKEHVHLFLKECERRFNYRPVANLNKTLQQWRFK